MVIMVSHQGLRASASVIISLKGLVNATSPASFTCKSLGKNVVKPESNIKVLTLRRGQSDKVLPGLDVFPGGHVEPSDFNSEWLNLYASNGYGEDTFHKLSSVPHPSLTVPEVKDSVPPWLGFRISAIRETFEECGILLCRCPGGVSTTSPWLSYTLLHDTEAWQKRVIADPHQLLTLCQSKGCVPDVWALHLWNNWVTPFHIKKRFNTVFYLAVLQSEPPHLLDLREMDSLSWSTPDALLEGSTAGTFSLMIPQLYEISRLAQFSSAESLAEFASCRAEYACPTWMSAWYHVQDGFMFLLPGDSQYPDGSCFERGDIGALDCTINESVERVCSQSGTVHRVVQFKKKKGFHILIHNYQPDCNHVLPVAKEACSLSSKI